MIFGFTKNSIIWFHKAQLLGGTFILWSRTRPPVPLQGSMSMLLAFNFWVNVLFT